MLSRLSSPLMFESGFHFFLIRLCSQSIFVLYSIAAGEIFSFVSFSFLCYTQSPFSSLSLSRIIYNCNSSSHLLDLSSETLPTVKSFSCFVINCSPLITITVLICPALRVRELAVLRGFLCRDFLFEEQQSAKGGITALFVGTK